MSSPAPIVGRGSLISILCPSCQRTKKSGECFCKTCYFALPLPLRNSLWIRRTDVISLKEWEEKYRSAFKNLAMRGLTRRSAS